MPETPETIKAFLKGAFQVAIENVLKSFSTAAEKFIDQIWQDVFNVKGHWDDTVFNIIKSAYRKARGEESYSALMRLIGFLTEPEHQELGVISIGMLALTYHREEPLAEGKIPKPELKSGEKDKTISVVEKNFALFLDDFDFQIQENYAVLFNSYDFLISDFLRLEKEGRADRNEVARLMRSSSLYADNTLKKRLAGALMHVRDWPAALRKWRQKGWLKIIDSFQVVNDWLNVTFGQRARESRQRSADALVRARERFNNTLNQY